MENLFNIPLCNDDFSEHNEEQIAVWNAYYSQKPIRVPVTYGINPRVLLCDPKYNTKNITFEDYWNNPEIMMQTQCEFDYFRKHYVYCDQNMGIPYETGWRVYVDTQNFSEAAWFGAEIKFIKGDVPDTKVLLTEDRKNILFEKGIPDPFANVFGHMKRFYEYFKESNFTYMGVPVYVVDTMLGTDGPFTIACNLRGAADFCVDMYCDPDYAKQLLDYITEATIQRIRAFRKYYGLPTPDGMFFADDSIALLSKKDYEEWILPYHKRIVNELTTGNGKNNVHFCGDSTRHFKIMTEQLNVNSFDTGYPVNHGELARELGEDIEIYGGPTVDVLRNGSKEQVIEATKAILNDVIPISKRFILRDANNVPPGTPLENLRAMYETARLYGKYE